MRYDAAPYTVDISFRRTGGCRTPKSPKDSLPRVWRRVYAVGFCAQWANTPNVVEQTGQEGTGAWKEREQKLVDTNVGHMGDTFAYIVAAPPYSICQNWSLPVLGRPESKPLLRKSWGTKETKSFYRLARGAKVSIPQISGELLRKTPRIFTSAPVGVVRLRAKGSPKKLGCSTFWCEEDITPWGEIPKNL